MSQAMMAVRVHAFGDPDVLSYEEAPRPTIGADEVLVRVHAAGIDPPDLYLRDGYRSLPREWQPHPTFRSSSAPTFREWSLRSPMT